MALATQHDVLHGVRSVARARRRRCTYRTAIGAHCMSRDRPALRRRGPVVSRRCTACARQSSRRGEAVFAAASAWASSRRVDVSRRRARSAARPRRRRAVGEASARKSSPHADVYPPRPVRVLRAVVAVVVLSKSAAAARLTSKLALVGGVCRATGLALVAEQLVGVAHVGVAAGPWRAVRGAAQSGPRPGSVSGPALRVQRLRQAPLLGGGVPFAGPAAGPPRSARSPGSPPRARARAGSAAPASRQRAASFAPPLGPRRRRHRRPKQLRLGSLLFASCRPAFVKLGLCANVCFARPRTPLLVRSPAAPTIEPVF
jgi:hypothetical protein